MPGFMGGGGGLGGHGHGHEAPKPGTEHYKTLGVPTTASKEDIRRAFLALARQHHTDRSGGDREAFQKISAAKEVLLDEEFRRAYDMGGDEAVQQLKHEPVPDIMVEVQCRLTDVYTGTVSKAIQYGRQGKSDGVVIKEKVDAKIEVPAGAVSGMRIVQQGAGHLGRGNVVVVFRVADAAGKYKRVSFTDVEYTLDLPLWKALSCPYVDLPSVLGHEDAGPLRVAVPGTPGRVLRPGDKLVLPGMGLPLLADPGATALTYGSLIVVCNVVVPETLPRAVALNVSHALGSPSEDAHTAPCTHSFVALGEDDAKERQLRADALVRAHQAEHSEEGAGGPAVQQVQCAQS